MRESSLTPAAVKEANTDVFIGHVARSSLDLSSVEHTELKNPLFALLFKKLVHGSHIQTMP